MKFFTNMLVNYKVDNEVSVVSVFKKYVSSKKRGMRDMVRIYVFYHYVKHKSCVMIYY